jgi:hypothetical protein
MTDKPEKTTGQVIREGEKVAKRQRTMRKALRDTAVSKGDINEAHGRAALETGLAEDLSHEKAKLDEQARAEDFRLTGKSDAPSGWNRGSDRSAVPSSDDPTRPNTLPSRVAKGMPNQGLPMVTEDAHLYVGTGMRAHEDKGSSDQAIAERHRKNFDAAKAEGDLAGMVQHKQALHNHLNKKGWATSALCKNDNCGNEVGISDYDKGAAAPEHTAKYADAAAGEAPCRSCLASGRE